MTDEEKFNIISKALGKYKKCFKSDHPTIDEFINNSWLKNKKRWKNNRRLNKKFKRNIRKYLTKRARREVLSIAFCKPLRQRLDYVSIIRKCFDVEPLPAGAIPIYTE
jgi:transcriptional accessory protein Tex/SPT6